MTGNETSLTSWTQTMSGVKTIGFGALHSGLEKVDGSMLMVGANDHGNLGLGNFNYSHLAPGALPCPFPDRW